MAGGELGELVGAFAVELHVDDVAALHGVLVGGGLDHGVAGDGGGGGTGEVHRAIGVAAGAVVSHADVFQDALIEGAGGFETGELGGDGGVLGQQVQVVRGLDEGGGAAAGHALIALRGAGVGHLHGLLGELRVLAGHEAELQEGGLADAGTRGVALLIGGAGDLDGEAVVADGGDDGLVGAEGVDTAAEHLEDGLVGAAQVRGHLGGGLGVERVAAALVHLGEVGDFLLRADFVEGVGLELLLVDGDGEAGAALQVKAQAHLVLHREGDIAREGDQNGQNRPLDQAGRIHVLEVQHCGILVLLLGGLDGGLIRRGHDGATRHFNGGAGANLNHEGLLLGFLDGADQATGKGDLAPGAELGDHLLALLLLALLRTDHHEIEDGEEQDDHHQRVAEHGGDAAGLRLLGSLRGVLHRDGGRAAFGFAGGGGRGLRGSLRGGLRGGSLRGRGILRHRGRGGEQHGGGRDDRHHRGQGRKLGRNRPGLFAHGVSFCQVHCKVK